MKKYDEFDVTVVASEKNAFEQMNGKKINMIVIDCSHPQMDGYRLTQKIRQYDKEHSQYHVIIGLGETPKTDGSKKWLMVGMDDYCQKPISVKNIVNILKKYKERSTDDYI